MLAYNALLVKNEGVSFVLEHGDCVFQEKDNGQKGAQ